MPGLAAVLVVQGVGEAVGVGAGFDDGAVEGQPVHDRDTQPGSVKVFVHPEKDSLLAIAVEFFSSSLGEDLEQQSLPPRR